MNIDRQADSKLSLGSPDLWHNRARESALETRKLLITLATACLAVFFITLTGDNAGKLNFAQRAFARAGLLSMGISILFGVVANFCDARRCYNLARHIQAKAANETTLADAFHSRFVAYFRTLTICNWIQRLAFLTGIAATVIYTFSLVS
jgi:hypothetical protein